MKMTLLLIKVMFVLALSQTNLKAQTLLGQFDIVTTRQASDVSSTLPPFGEQNSPIGHTITFTPDGLEMTGMGCDQWQIIESDNAFINLHDPMLADLNIEPTDSQLSSGDQRILKNYAYLCEGEPFLQVFQLDERVVVIPWENSSQYLIAEIPLTELQLKQFQKQLKSMKFYSSEINGQLDDATVKSIRSWVRYRSINNDDFTFQRPAITENLLDTLGVIDIK